MKKLLLLTSLVMIAFSCSVTKKQKPSTDENPFYIQKFVSGWDDKKANYSFELNESETMVLCIRKTTDAPSVFDYKVYNLSTKEEVFKSGLIGTGVSWHSENEVILIGTSRIENSPPIIINIDNGESRPLKVTKKK